MDINITLYNLGPRIVQNGFFTRKATATFNKKEQQVRLVAYKDSDFRLTCLLNRRYKAMENPKNIHLGIRVENLLTGELICYI